MLEGLVWYLQVESLERYDCIGLNINKLIWNGEEFVNADDLEWSGLDLVGIDKLVDSAAHVVHNKCSLEIPETRTT